MAQIEGGNLVRFSQYAAPEKTRSADMPCNLASSSALAMSGCSFVTDDSTALMSRSTASQPQRPTPPWRPSHRLRKHGPKATHDRFSASSYPPTTCRKTELVIVFSANGEKRYEGNEAADVLATLDFDRWTPVTTEEFESRTSGIALPVSMTLSQDKTVLAR